MQGWFELPKFLKSKQLSTLLSGYAGYKLCYQEVLRVVKGIVHQPLEVKGSSVFYAFSYYYDRAVDSGLIGEWGYIREKGHSCYTSLFFEWILSMLSQCLDKDRGGTVEVRDFKKRAKEGKTLDVLPSCEAHSGQSPAAHIAQT